MPFHGGEQVEVCSKQEGFVGSYYDATVLKYLDYSNLYVVEYKNLVEEDETTPLIEKVLPDEIRPLPPRTPPSVMFSGFSLLDRVDAFDNDGWWVGKITGRRGSKYYYVFFETTGDEISYHASKLRIHQDWVNGKWVFSKKREH